jgi:hypothetical protein
MGKRWWERARQQDKTRGEEVKAKVERCRERGDPIVLVSRRLTCDAAARAGESRAEKQLQEAFTFSFRHTSYQNDM